MFDADEQTFVEDGQYSASRPRFGLT